MKRKKQNEYLTAWKKGAAIMFMGLLIAITFLAFMNGMGKLICESSIDGLKQPSNVHGIECESYPTGAAIIFILFASFMIFVAFPLMLGGIW